MRLVDIVTRGYIKRKYGPTSRPKIDFSWQGEVATVSWEPARKTWYLSAWREDWGGILESATADTAPAIDVDSLRVAVSIGIDQAKENKVPPGWIVFNTTRPLVGDIVWEGDFTNGRHYAAVDPNGDRAAWMVSKNKGLDGWIYQVVDNATMKALVRQDYLDSSQEGDTPIDEAMSYLDETGYKHEFGRILEGVTFGQFKDMLAKATAPKREDPRYVDKNGPGDHLGDILAGRVGPDWPEGFTNKVTLTGAEAEAATAEIINNDAMSYEERSTELKRITSAGMISGSDYGTALWKLVDKEKAGKRPWEMTKEEIIQSSLRLSYDGFGDQAVSRLNHQRVSSGRPVMKDADERSLRVQATIASRARFTDPIMAAKTFQDIAAVFVDVFGVTLGDEPVMEAAQIRTPVTVDENIQRGTEAMNRVISKHVNEPRAMYRQELGWIAFYWGKPGGGPPLFRGGSGISHIIAKRDWEGEHVKELLGQKGAAVAIKLVSVIATSKDISVLSGKRLVIKKRWIYRLSIKG